MVNMAECTGLVYRPGMPTRAGSPASPGMPQRWPTLPRDPGGPAGIPRSRPGAHPLGGRPVNPPGEFGAIYLALDVDTARRESDAPEVILEIDGRLSKVCDLTRPETQRQCGLTADQLCGGDHGPCQLAGRALRDNGYEAVRYPSAAGDGINLAVFWDRRQRDSSLRLAGNMEADD